jgi:hypothetical protein
VVATAASWFGWPCAFPVNKNVANSWWCNAFTVSYTASCVIAICVYATAGVLSAREASTGREHASRAMSAHCVTTLPLVTFD